MGNYVHNLNGTTGGGGNAEWGIAVEGGSKDIITQNNLQNCQVGIELTAGFNNNTISDNAVTMNGAPSSGPRSYCYGITVCSNYNILSTNTISAIFTPANAYYGGDGIYLNGGQYNSVNGNVITQCYDAGISLSSSSSNNNLLGNTISDTSNIGGDATGIFVCSNSNYISQNQVFDDRSGSSRTQGEGIYMLQGALNNVLVGNNVHNNLWNQIYDANVPENTMINNIGYNPVGPIKNPIASNTAYLVDSGTSSTWISGKTYTNSGSVKDLYISGGTVTAIVQDGRTLASAASTITIILQPGDTFSVTFTVTPTINVIGQ